MERVTVSSLVNPDKAGFLSKRACNFNVWQARWCVLHENKLHYFRTNKVSGVLGFFAESVINYWIW